jgi:hypothetical protein
VRRFSGHARALLWTVGLLPAALPARDAGAQIVNVQPLIVVDGSTICAVGDAVRGPGGGTGLPAGIRSASAQAPSRTRVMRSSSTACRAAPQ